MAKIGQPPNKGSATAAGPNMNPPPYAEGKPKVVKEPKGSKKHSTIDGMIDACVKASGKYGFSRG
jgi:hypothetical protein